MGQIWFLYSGIEATVSGPFTTEQLQARLEQGDEISENFVWWKGQREWLPVSSWHEQLPKLIELNANELKQKAVWYIDVGHSPMGPLTQGELLANLQAREDLSRVRLWAVGMKKWLGIFELHDIMELLGITRREHDRAPLMGSVAVTRANEDPRGFVVKAASVSVAGMGLADAHDLRRGDEVSLLIKSQDLPIAVHARGEVVYVTQNGYAGVRFSKITPESQTILQNHVNRFNVVVATGNQQAA